jgi:signal transduction histidine kinase
VRHGLLMAVKESLNNVVRHAHATEVEFRLATVENTLEIVIADNGHGFETDSPSDRHGVKNLSARLAALGGSCRVESAPGQGTTVRIRLPLNPVTPAGPATAAS